MNNDLQNGINPHYDDSENSVILPMTQTCLHEAVKQQMDSFQIFKSLRTTTGTATSDYDRVEEWNIFRTPMDKASLGAASL